MSAHLRIESEIDGLKGFASQARWNVKAGTQEVKISLSKPENELFQGESFSPEELVSRFHRLVKEGTIPDITAMALRDHIGCYGPIGDFSEVPDLSAMLMEPPLRKKGRPVRKGTAKPKRRSLG